MFLLGVSGGSGSGKTTLSRALQAHFGSRCAVLAQDSYYIDQSARFDGDGGSVNFDHPDSLEFSLLARHLRELKAGRAVEIPIYDFATHSRRSQTKSFSGAEVVIVDGTLLLSQPEILEILDACLFVDAPEADRYARRLKRDVEERGRTPEGVKAQFERQVKPMHDVHIEAHKHRACLVVSGVQPFEAELASVLAFLKSRNCPGC